MHPGPAAVIDALNSLLESEVNSIVRFMGEGYPYLNRATADVRKPLQDMVRRREERIVTLAAMIEHLGGVPHTAPPGVDPEEQYLAFLSFKFLLPKLVHAKRLILERYENTLRALRQQTVMVEPEVLHTLEALTAEHRTGLKVLERAST